jgi:hypothetical protein
MRRRCKRLAIGDVIDIIPYGRGLTQGATGHKQKGNGNNGYDRSHGGAGFRAVEAFTLRDLHLEQK